MKPAETLNDITHEMRIPGTEYPTKKDLRALADRIEAAALRARVDAREYACNAYALREALTRIMRYCASDDAPDALVREWVEVAAREALVMPARNCDRYPDYTSAYFSWADSPDDSLIFDKWLFASAEEESK